MQGKYRRGIAAATEKRSFSALMLAGKILMPMADLTQITKHHNEKFPRQEIYDCHRRRQSACRDTTTSMVQWPDAAVGVESPSSEA